MAEKLLFTGGWPPHQYLNQYPNWSNAWDEEGEGYIDEETAFTMADATLADGRTCLAIVQVDYGDP